MPIVMQAGVGRRDMWSTLRNELREIVWLASLIGLSLAGMATTDRQARPRSAASTLTGGGRMTKAGRETSTRVAAALGPAGSISAPCLYRPSSRPEAPRRDRLAA